MEKIDQGQFAERIDRISEIFSQLAYHAEQQALSRCPYKNRLDCCTAQFGCRNQRDIDAQCGLPACRGDDQLNYRHAWEVEAQDEGGL
ncbi:MAG: hypothetical protein CMJ75_22205 [Planctomycetaceae bacterium]|nr:hypothetical protein [Planctomycetaceae bacterium]